MPNRNVGFDIVLAKTIMIAYDNRFHISRLLTLVTNSVFCWRCFCRVRDLPMILAKMLDYCGFVNQFWYVFATGFEKAAPLPSSAEVCFEATIADTIVRSKAFLAN